MPVGLNDSEASRLAGVSRTAIQKAKDRGRIEVLPDGSIDPKALDIWTAGRRAPRGGASATKAQPATKSAPDATDGVAAENAQAALKALEKPGGVFETRQEAEKVRDSYVAHLRRIEFEKESGLLVPIEKVVTAIETDYSRVRSRLMSIPAEQAPQIHRCKTVAETQDLLLSIIVEALEELSSGAEAEFRPSV